MRVQYPLLDIYRFTNQLLKKILEKQNCLCWKGPLRSSGDIWCYHLQPRYCFYFLSKNWFKIKHFREQVVPCVWDLVTETSPGSGGPRALVFYQHEFTKCQVCGAKATDTFITTFFLFFSLFQVNSSFTLNIFPGSKYWQPGRKGLGVTWCSGRCPCPWQKWDEL